jgi:TP901 family phage tail tape measure protein
MSRMSLDTAIRLSAEVKGGGAIDRVKRSLQDFGKTGQTSKRDLDKLRAATFQFSRANDQTIAGIRNSINAFRGLQEQARIGGREFKRYGEEIQRLEAKLSGLDGAATKASASLGQKLAAGLAAAGVGRALQGITQQAANFDAELRKAAAISPTEGAFGTLKRSIEEVAAAAAGTPTEVAALATALSRAGFTADEVSASLAGVVKGAEATSVSFDQMGGITADVLRAFGMQVSQTNEVVDVLTKTSNTSNQTVLDLGESLKYAAPTARSLGVSLTDLAGTLGVLANNGIRGSEAGTALRTGFSRLQLAAAGSNEELLGLTRGNALLANAMRQLGAEVTNADGSLKSMDEVFISLKRQIDNIASPGQRIEIVKAIFGEESGGKLRALLNSTEGDIKKFFDGVRDAAGTTDQTRAAMDSFQLSTKRLGGNIENLTNQIGGMIGAALKPLIDGLNAAIGASQQLPEPVKQIGAAAAAAGLATLGLVAAINALKVSLGVVGGIQSMTAALAAKAGAATGAAGAIKALTLALALKAAAVGGIVIGLGFFVRALVNAATKNDRFRQSLRDGAVSASEGRKRLSELNAEVDALQVRLAQEPNGRLLNSLRGKIRRTAQEARLLRQEIEILEFWGEKGRAAGGSPNAGEYYQPGVGYFNLETGRFSRPDDRAVPPSMPSAGMPTAAAGSGGSGGGSGGGRSGSGSAPSFQPSSRARALMAAAQKLGVSPLDLATIISFETGGTFSPSTWGGAGGNYMGLIQFGGPERKQYGANQNQSFEEQVTGPVVRYFQDRFGKVGMSTQGASLEDLYTTVLAGNPRANRNSRDSFGTSPRSGVAAMGPHRQKALQTFFGGSMSNVGFGSVEQAEAANAGFQAQQQLQEQQEQQLDTSKRIRQEVEMTAIAMRVMNPLHRSIVEAENEAIKILQKYSDLKAKALSDGERENLAAAQKLEIESNALKLSEQLNNESKGLTSELEKIAKEAGDRLAFEREYAALLKGGMNPELARQYLEIDKIVESTKANFDARIRILEASALQLSSESEVRKEIEKQVALLKEKSKAIDDIAEQSKQDIESSTVQSEEQKIEGQIQALKEELSEMTSLSAQVAFAAKSIGDAFGSSFKSIVDGSKSTREALSDFFASIAESYLQMAVDIIAKQVQMIILQTILNAIGGAVSGGASSGSAATPGSPSTGIFAVPELKAPRAMGGPVNPGEIRPVGERGPELFVPYQAGTIIPAEATEALAAINSAAQGRLMVPYMGGGSGAAVSGQRGTSGLSVPFQGNGQQGGGSGLSVPFLKGADGMDGAAGGGGLNDPIRFESVLIGEVEYVTRSEAEEIGRRSEQRGAQRGAALAEKRARNNVTTRRSYR